MANKFISTFNRLLKCSEYSERLLGGIVERHGLFLQYHIHVRGGPVLFAFHDGKTEKKVGRRFKKKKIYLG